MLHGLMGRTLTRALAPEPAPWPAGRSLRPVTCSATRRPDARARRGPGRNGGKERVRSAKGRRIASTRWLARHLGDPYVQRAHKEGYRSRAAYKLLEIDEKHGLLKPGRRVLDLGSAPGGWLQVAARRGARVVGVDLDEVAPVGGAAVLQGDIFDEATP